MAPVAGNGFLAGAALWIMLQAGPLPGWENHTAVLLFSLLFLTPLGLSAARPAEPPPSHLFRTARFLQIFAALITAVAFFVAPGVLGGTFAVAWLTMTAMTAIDGLRRFGRDGFSRLEEVLSDLGLIYLFLAALCLWLERMGAPPGGLTAGELLFIAARFHIAGCGGLLLAAGLGRRLRASQQGGFLWLGGASVLILAAPALTALSLLLPGIPGATAELVQAGGYLGLALALVFAALPTATSALVRGSLIIPVMAGLAAAGVSLMAALGGFGDGLVFSAPALQVLGSWAGCIFVVAGLVAYPLIRKR